MPSSAVDVMWLWLRLWLWSWSGFNFNSTKSALAARDDGAVDSCQLGAALVQRPEEAPSSTTHQLRTQEMSLSIKTTRRL